MVSKGTSTKGSAQAIDYALNDKGQALELDRNLIGGDTGDEIIQEFREIQAQNYRCENNTYSIILSPEQGKNFTPEQMKEFGHQHLKNLGLEDHQYLMTLHRSTEQPHIHIIANRISLTGEAHNDSFISKKCQSSAEKIAKEHGLLTAKDIHKYKNIDVKKDIQRMHDLFKKKVNTFGEYKSAMSANNIDILPTINKSGVMQGYKLHHKKSGLTLKASEVGKNIGLGDLAKNGISFAEKVPTPVMKIVNQVSKVIQKSFSYEHGF